MEEEKRTEIYKVTGIDSDLLEFWYKQQELARECGVEVEELD